MKSFITKNKFKILFLAILYILLFLFVPLQKDYYLKSDIQNFEDNYFWKIMIVSTLIFSLIFFMKLNLFLKSFFKKNAGIEKLKRFISILIISFFGSILFDSIIISTILFVNRMKTEKRITEVYEVIYADNENLVAIKRNPTEIIYGTDYKRFHQIKKIESYKVNDPLELKFNKGILGIRFIDN